MTEETNNINCLSDSKLTLNNQNVTTITSWNINKQFYDNNTAFNSRYTSQYEKQFVCTPDSNCKINCDLLNCNHVLINASLAESFSLTCHHGRNCLNMNIIVGNNTSSNLDVNTDNTQILPPTTTIANANHTDAKFTPNKRIFESIGIYVISLIIGSIAIILIFAAIIFILRHYGLIQYYYKKKQGKYISNKPTSFIYYFSGIAAILIFISMNWWFIKFWVFVASDKCFKTDADHCQTDYFCTADCKHTLNWDSDVSAGLATVWVVGYILITVSVIIRGCVGLKFYKDGAGPSWKKYGKKWEYEISYFNHDEYLLCFAKGKHGVMSDDYIDRVFWSGRIKDEYDCTGCQWESYWHQYIFDHLVTYLFCFVVAWVYTELIDVYVFEETHGIDFYSVLILLLTKIGLQIWYTFQDKYDQAKDEYHERLEIEMDIDRQKTNILENMLGPGPTLIIKSYLPYYTTNGPIELRINFDDQCMVRDDDTQRSKSHKKRKKKGSTFELLLGQSSDDEY